MNDNTLAGIRWRSWCPCGDEEGVSPLPVGSPAPAIGDAVPCGVCHCHHIVSEVNLDAHRILTASATTVDALRDALHSQGVETISTVCAWCLEVNAMLASALDEDTRPLSGAVLMCSACSHPSMGVEVTTDRDGRKWLALRVPNVIEMGQIMSAYLASAIGALGVDGLERLLDETDGGE